MLEEHQEGPEAVKQRGQQKRPAQSEASGDPQVGSRRDRKLDRGIRFTEVAARGATVARIRQARVAARRLVQDRHAPYAPRKGDRGQGVAGAKPKALHRRRDPPWKACSARVSLAAMRRLAERIRFGIVGVGWVGQEIARAAFEDPRVTLVGVADSDPAKAGRDLGELIGAGRLGVPIESTAEAMLARARPEVAVVSTKTDLDSVRPVLEACLASGTHVLTTCENLVDPDVGGAQLALDFDRRARAAGLVLLATGANPGFAMDRLPVTLAQATRNVRRIRVARFIDANSRRAQLLQKAGIGLTPHGFGEATRNGDVGHVGLGTSLNLIARGLGISLDKTAEVFRPVLAASPTMSVLGAIPSGRVRGVQQVARGYRRGREVITLELSIIANESNPRDTIDIVGEPPLHFEGELPGDQCTVATVLSAIAVIVTMAPGVRTVLELPLEQPEEPPSDDHVVSQRPRAVVAEEQGKDSWAARGQKKRISHRKRVPGWRRGSKKSSERYEPEEGEP